MTPSVILETVADLLETEATTLRLVAENTESRSTDFRVQTILTKIDRLKRQQDRLHQLIASIKDRERRRRDLEKLRQQNDTESDRTNEAQRSPAKLSYPDRVIRDQTGKVVGRRLRYDGKEVFLTAGGKLIGWEKDDRTFAKTGEFRGYGRQGLRLVGTSQNARKPPLKGRQG